MDSGQDNENTIRFIVSFSVSPAPAAHPVSFCAVRPEITSAAAGRRALLSLDFTLPRWRI